MAPIHILLAVAALSSSALSAAVKPFHQKRATAGQGWSLQSATCPSGAKSCGNGSCCPSSSYCQSTGNGEVPACCLTSSNCRGSVEGAPSCADSAWSLWKGNYGNGFCCEVGLTGAYQAGGTTAGICVTSIPSGYTAAQLMTQGTGSPTGGGNPTTTSTTSSTTTTETSPPTGSAPRAVFAHYMVGTIDQADATTDVKAAKAVGFDAFALNTHTISSSDTWMLNALEYLFQAADDNDFKLFISFDMSWKTFQPSDIPAFLQNYISHPSYYTVGGKPFVSTYSGGYLDNNNWNSGFRQPMINAGHTPFFVPDFDDWSGYPSNFFNTYTVADGAFSWEAAWPSPGTSVSNVSDSVDQTALNQAHAAGKVYMMPLSSFQFKYMGSGQDWYRIGEVNMPQRFEQVLQLQPDFVELITWNDAGESHYVGNFYQSQIDGTNIGDYANGFDHTGWQKIITPFINAYKNGATDGSQISPGSSPTGSLWYRTLLTSASCSSSIQNYQQGQNTVNFAVILPSSGYTINVYSGGNLLGSFAGKAGLNYNAVPGLQVGGGQKLEILNSANNVVASAVGTKDVSAQSSSSTCNWNYEVVGF